MLVCSTSMYSQNREFTNYFEMEKELVVLDFGYIFDSSTSISITRNEAEAVYQFIEKEIQNFSVDYNKAFDAPFRFSFKNKNAKGTGHWETQRSKFLFGSMFGITNSWPDSIVEIAGSTLDYSKELYIEIGPTKAFYQSLLSEPSDGDYAFEYSYSDIGRSEQDDKIYKSQISALSPVYQGGFIELNRFLYERIVKPIKEEIPNYPSYNLVYWITIEKDGSISEIKPNSNALAHQKDFKVDILKELGNMPNWRPANKYGQAVRSQYEIQIRVKPQFYENLLSVDLD